MLVYQRPTKIDLPNLPAKNIFLRPGHQVGPEQQPCQVNLRDEPGPTESGAEEVDSDAEMRDGVMSSDQLTLVMSCIEGIIGIIS